MSFDLDVIMLGRGHPGAEILDALPKILVEATTHCMKRQSNGTADFLQYGPNTGDEDFRTNLANFLSEKYGSVVKSDNLFLTNGASSGLALICSIFPPETVVLIEDPTYFFAFDIFKSLRKTFIPVKTDDFGIVVEDLEEKLKQHTTNLDPNGLPLASMIYTIPVFHNPMGTLLPEDRCRQLVSLARKYHSTIVCDDVYNLLYYSERASAPKRLFEFDDQPDSKVGNVVSNCSFSKILGPGLRIGWIEGPKWVLDELENIGSVQSGGSLNAYTSGIVTSLLFLGTLNSHLEFTRNVYKERMRAAICLLRNNLPEDCLLKSAGEGGYFIWIELPKAIVAEEFLLFCTKRYRVSFMLGQRTSPTGKFSNCIRLSISLYSLDVLMIALKKLCEAISDYQNKTSSS